MPNFPMIGNQSEMGAETESVGGGSAELRADIGGHLINY